MNLDDQVCSFELAKKLKKLGVKQESLFFWREHGEISHSSKYVDPRDWSKVENIKCIAAFTASELGEMLPDYIVDYPGHGQALQFRKWGTKYIVEYHRVFEAPLRREEATTEADARAKMLIYLLENKLITL